MLQKTPRELIVRGRARLSPIINRGRAAESKESKERVDSARAWIIRGARI